MIKTMYQTSDGYLFEETDKDKAIQHENELAQSVYMFNNNGIRVDRTEQAVFVYLPLHFSAFKFIEMSEKNEASCQGIEEESTGWFYWDSWESCYERLPNGFIRGLLNAVEYVSSIDESIKPVKDAEKSTKKAESFVFNEVSE